jgi:hypothetical protein
MSIDNSVHQYAPITTTRRYLDEIVAMVINGIPVRVNAVLGVWSVFHQPDLCRVPGSGNYGHGRVSNVVPALNPFLELLASLKRRPQVRADWIITSNVL